MDKLQWAFNRMPPSDDRWLEVMSLEHVAKARAFHESFPQYAVTPLAAMPELAKRMGLGGLWVKDESWRFGLNAFKVLGGSFANLTGEDLHREFGRPPSSPPRTATTAGAWPGRRSAWGRRRWCTCRRAAAAPAMRTSPGKEPR